MLSTASIFSSSKNINSNFVTIFTEIYFGLYHEYSKVYYRVESAKIFFQDAFLTKNWNKLKLYL